MNLTTMMTFKIVFCMVLMTYHSVISKREENTIVNSDIIRSSNIASNNVYKILGKTNGEKNILYCPLSTNILLSLITTAASGKTAKELKTALHLNIGNDDIKSGYQTMLKEFQDKKLHLATRLFPRTGVKLVPEFATTAQTYFYSDVQAVDYNNSEKAAKIINTFVEKKTNNKIHDLVDPKNLNGGTEIILVNAAHFSDRWLRPFRDTFTGDFHLGKDKKVKAPMMSVTDHYNYKELNSLKAKVLQIYFETSPYSFVIILPNKIGGIHEMETKLASTNFDEIMNNMVETYVKLTIPKFKIEDEIDLKSAFKKLGVETLFMKDANLNGLVRNSELHVSLFVQKSYMKVDEDGVEATAATEIALLGSSMPSKIIEIPIEFTADHPFVFTIMRGNVIIFQGRMSKI